MSRLRDGCRGGHGFILSTRLSSSFHTPTHPGGIDASLPPDCWPARRADWGAFLLPGSPCPGRQTKEKRRLTPIEKERNMKRFPFAAPALTILVVLALLFGCTYVSVETRKYLAVPSYPPTDPAAVRDPPRSADAAPRAVRGDLPAAARQPTRPGDGGQAEAGRRNNGRRCRSDSCRQDEVYGGLRDRSLVGTRDITGVRQGHRSGRDQVRSIDLGGRGRGPFLPGHVVSH